MNDKREKIVKWVTLFFGCFILLIQILRYSFDFLGNSYTEIVVLLLSLMLIVKPSLIPNIINKIIDKFLNKK